MLRVIHVSFKVYPIKPDKYIDPHQLNQSALTMRPEELLTYFHIYINVK